MTAFAAVSRAASGDTLPGQGTETSWETEGSMATPVTDILLVGQKCTCCYVGQRRFRLATVKARYPVTLWGQNCAEQDGICLH
jgi:hypothetical protein